MIRLGVVDFDTSNSASKRFSGSQPTQTIFSLCCISLFLSRGFFVEIIVVLSEVVYYSAVGLDWEPSSYG